MFSRFDTFKEIIKSKFNIIRSSVIGSIIGAIPGTGRTCCNIKLSAYKKMKNLIITDRFSSQGIISPEAANSSMSGGALIPMLHNSWRPGYRCNAWRFNNSWARARAINDIIFSRSILWSLGSFAVSFYS